MESFSAITSAAVVSSIVGSQHDRQLLLTFPDKCLFPGFTRLYLTAHKLPQQLSGLVGQTLANHKLVLIPDHGCYYFGNTFLTHVNNFFCLLLMLPESYLCCPLEDLLFIFIALSQSSIANIVQVYSKTYILFSNVYYI